METNGLLAAALTSDNLRSAWKRVKANKGAPGIDGIAIEDFPAHLRAHWGDIRRQLETGRYRPLAVRRVEIPKDDGGKRLLGIPTVMDRVIQQAIPQGDFLRGVAQVLTPIFEPGFSESSFGFRPGRNAHQAIKQVQAHVKDGYAIAVDIDLAKFFDAPQEVPLGDTVNHDVLMNIIGRTIHDKGLLFLIGRYLRAGVLVGEHIEPSAIGTPSHRDFLRSQAGRCRRSWPTSCSTNSTMNSNDEATASPVTPTTWSSWSKASGQENGSCKV